MNVTLSDLLKRMLEMAGSDLHIATMVLNGANPS